MLMPLKRIVHRNNIVVAVVKHLAFFNGFSTMGK